MNKLIRCLCLLLALSLLPALGHGPPWVLAGRRSGLQTAKRDPRRGF